MFFYKHLVLFLVLALNFVPANGVSRLSIDEQENIRIYEKSSRAVVNISNIAVNYDFFYRAIPAESGSGTGFIIGESGIIVTNYHVVENASKLVVTLSNNSQWPGKLIGADPNNDLAIVRIQAPVDSYDILEFSNSNDIVVGQKVLALGNPFGLRQTLTTGIISALGRTIAAKNGRKIEGIIQTDAAINPGNSGGPLLDSEGKVIGINTAIIGSAGSVGIGFAVPSNTALRILPDLLEYGYVRRPWLGIEPIPTVYLRRIGIDVPDGLLIARVVIGASADQAGLRGATRTVKVGRYKVPWGGDIITHINGSPVFTMEDLAQQIETRKSGDEVTISYIRKESVDSVIVKLVLRPRS
ncbi:MAG: trypsin-like peptidase domain-containing protein [SAR324 cluster bacterium]|uniref:PDZ domain-containing protein n=1 Tax=marine metagenome TaxID=408172 RepID=A0A381P4I9_9ZZZZ|nr:peptidase [Deltaproteobacteria bacterium]MCH2286785.1 trypsin-like peptidase domain-containing protein [SAR324 cluster bacterium]|tara:strand:- start:117 stop:1181 length:1065 start_codon:yes stop_codon:yes gene_type:complete